MISDTLPGAVAIRERAHHGSEPLGDAPPGRMNAHRRWLSLTLLVFATPVLAGALPGEEPKLARPTPGQLEWQRRELEMFIHFGPATWENVQHSDLSAPLAAINPEQLNTEQWVDVAVSMGAGIIIFVAKHDGGFCWWPTVTTDYSVRSTPWRNGTGDLMRELSDSCRRRGLKLGVYLSPMDKMNGAQVGGRTVNAADQDRYTATYRQQLTELLSRYGEIAEVWFDGGLGRAGLPTSCNFMPRVPWYSRALTPRFAGSATRRVSLRTRPGTRCRWSRPVRGSPPRTIPILTARLGCPANAMPA
jgi:hypothetical protein